MVALAVLGLVLVLVAGVVPFLVGEKTFRVVSISIVVVGAVLFSVFTPLALSSHFALSSHQRTQDYADRAFSSTAHELFVALRSVASNPVNQSNPAAGQISLKDPTTVVITPNSPAVVAPGLSSAFYTIPLKSSDPTLKITGNLAADNKSWCFDLTSADPNMRADKRQVLYTEFGQAETNTGYCLGGLAYDQNDMLISTTAPRG